MDPDLALDPGDFSVDRAGMKLKLLLGGRPVTDAEVVMAWFLDLDNWASCLRQFLELFVLDRGKLQYELVLIAVMTVLDHRGNAGRADRAEFDRPLAHLLRGLPDRGVLQGTAHNWAINDKGIVGFAHFIENPAGPDAGKSRKSGSRRNLLD